MRNYRCATHSLKFQWPHNTHELAVHTPYLGGRDKILRDVLRCDKLSPDATDYPETGASASTCALGAATTPLTTKHIGSMAHRKANLGLAPSRAQKTTVLIRHANQPLVSTNTPQQGVY